MGRHRSVALPPLSETQLRLGVEGGGQQAHAKLTPLHDKLTLSANYREGDRLEFCSLLFAC